jgi:phosphate-selective porin
MMRLHVWRMLSLSLLISALAVTGCAPSLPATGTVTASKTEMSDNARAEFEEKLVQRMKEEEGIFDVFSRKMDEYQDHISPAAEDSEIRASCALRLKAMRQELSELSDLLRDGQ